MNIVNVSTDDVFGGAAIAAYRLHNALRKKGHDASFFVANKRIIDKHVRRINGEKTQLYSHFANRYYLNASRSNLTNTLFSYTFHGTDISKCKEIRNADVINLHWVEFFLSIESIKKIAEAGKPIFWTLHDTKAFTGGCHYTAGCNNFKNYCKNCPQLVGEAQQVAETVLLEKLETFKHFPIHYITPSIWLAEELKESAVFKANPHNTVDIIPNSIDGNTFNQSLKKTAKSDLGLDENKTVILFGAVNANARRKGFKELMSAVKILESDPEVVKETEEGKLLIITMGKEDESLYDLKIPVHNFGSLSDMDKIAKIYAAADIFVLPSLEDNLPNTMLESMACGTPVIGFNTGGIPDAVIHNETGLIVEWGNVQKLSEAIKSLLVDKERRAEFSKNTIGIKEKYSPKRQVSSYVKIYQKYQTNDSVNQKININHDIFAPTIETEGIKRLKRRNQDRFISKFISKSSIRFILNNHPKNARLLINKIK